MMLDVAVAPRPDTLKPATGAGPKTLIVGADGSPGGLLAIRAARLVAERTGAAVRIIAVVDPLPAVAPEAGIAVPLTDLEVLRRQDMQAVVAAQIQEIAGPRASWDAEVLYGDPASVLARIARETEGALLVVGRNSHGFTDRLLGFETMPRLLRLTTVPVLVAGANLVKQPRRIVSAVDFDGPSLAAVGVALGVFPEVGAISLVHVRPAARLPAAYQDGWVRGYEAGVVDAFTRALRMLSLPSTITVERVTLTGNVSHELTEFADFSRADLLVVGTRARGFMARFLEGSVATRVAREAQCSVLVVPERVTVSNLLPPRPQPPAGDAPDRNHWQRLLNDYANRNIGRRVSLEVDDDSLGAQAQVRDYILMGADFDPKSGRAEIMVGDGVDPLHHLTHGMSEVSSVDLMRDEEGRDKALRIRHRGGQTIVTS